MLRHGMRLFSLLAGWALQCSLSSGRILVALSVPVSSLWIGALDFGGMAFDKRLGCPSAGRGPRTTQVTGASHEGSSPQRSDSS